MRRKRNNFLEQIKPKASPPKPVSQMSEAELDAEEDRLKEELRQLREQEGAAQREQREAAKPSRFIFAGKPKKRYWK